MRAENRLRQLLEVSGCVAAGWTEIKPVDEAEWKIFEDWLAAGFHGEMTYMERYRDIRRDPRLLLPGSKTIISVAFNYRQPNPFSNVATYALGQDYHKVIRRRLKRVVNEMRSEFGGEWRICIDSAPVLERYWAQRCGIGYRSPLHGNIIVPGIGSMVFLAEIITTLVLPEMSEPQRDDESCFMGAKSACPTGALKENGIVDSRLCINYLTIEKRGSLNEHEMSLAGKAFFGCDLCQKACPSYRWPLPPVVAEFRPLPGLERFIRGEDGPFDLSASPMARAFAKRRSE